MPLLLAAPDKFRGSATAAQVATAAAAGAAVAGWEVDPCPLADGGEGLLEVVGGRLCRSEVAGPDGRQAVVAQWRLRADGTAVIEMAQAAGLSLAGGRERNRPLAATTTGVGQLVVEAVAAGARRVVVGCGGSASTDGGSGAVAAIGDPGRLGGVELVAAVDVDTSFVDAARVFGPQKGAGPGEVALLSARLDALAARYQERFGVDVGTLRGAGAAGGLAGGLAALGARIVGGLDLVADLVGLEARLRAADAVMTGEGQLDRSSLAGKVVGALAERTPVGVPLLCVVGSAEDEAKVLLGRAREGRGLLHVVELVEEAGPLRARSEVDRLVAGAVTEELRRLSRP